jgi:hypothetical protein
VVWHGHLAAAKWLLATCLFGDEEEFTCMDAAAARGNLEMLQWMHQTGRITMSRNIMAKALSSGHLDIVWCIHTNSSDETIFTEGSMDGAAANGHLDSVQRDQENRREGCTAAAMVR